MDTSADGSILGGEPKGIKAHGMEHIESLHSLEAGAGVGRGHSVPMSDVEVP